MLSSDSIWVLKTLGEFAAFLWRESKEKLSTTHNVCLMKGAAMIYEGSTPDPNPLGSGDAPDDSVEQIPMEDIAAFMRDLREQNDSEGTDSDALVKAFNEAKAIIEKAVEMNNEGPDSGTPLAQLLNNDTISASLIAVMMAPQFSDFDKIRFVGSIVLVGVKEYGIQL